MITEKQHLDAIRLKDEYLKLHLEQCDIIAEFEKQNEKLADRPRLEIIKQRVAILKAMYQLDLKSRKREILIPRQALQYWLKKNTQLTLTEIGKMTGGKDHATVLHSTRQIESFLFMKDQDMLELCRPIWDALDDVKRPSKHEFSKSLEQ